MAIGDVAAELGIPQYLLRYWETRFPQIQPIRKSRGRRRYTPATIEFIRGIVRLTQHEGLSLSVVQRLVRGRGVEFMRQVGRGEATIGPVSATPHERERVILAGSRLQPDQRAALVDALADPEACMALARICLAKQKHAASRPAPDPHTIRRIGDAA